MIYFDRNLEANGELLIVELNALHQLINTTCNLASLLWKRLLQVLAYTIRIIVLTAP